MKKRIKEIEDTIQGLRERIVYLENEKAELLALTEKANAYDELNKVVQTVEGNGTIENPYKNWSVGMSVVKDKWYLTSEGYLWMAIKDGYPTSEIDEEYFDVIL